MGNAWCSRVKKRDTDFGSTSSPLRRARAVSPEGVSPYFVLSPNGDQVAAVGPDHKLYLFRIGRGEPAPVSGAEPDEGPTGWSADGRALYVFRFGQIPARVFQLDLSTGQRKLWKELLPADAAGIDTIRGIMLTRDAKAYVYGYVRTLSDL